MKFHHPQQGKHLYVILFQKAFSREENSCTNALFVTPSGMIKYDLCVFRVEGINILNLISSFYLLNQDVKCCSFCWFEFEFFFLILECEWYSKYLLGIFRVPKLMFHAVSWWIALKLWKNPAAPMQFSSQENKKALPVFGGGEIPSWLQNKGFLIPKIC